MNLDDDDYNETAAAREHERAAERRRLQIERLAEEARESEPIVDAAELDKAVGELAGLWGLKRKKARKGR